MPQPKLEDMTSTSDAQNTPVIDPFGLAKDNPGTHAPKRRSSEGFWEFPCYLAAASVIPFVLPEEPGVDVLGYFFLATAATLTLINVYYDCIKDKIKSFYLGPDLEPAT